MSKIFRSILLSKYDTTIVAFALENASAICLIAGFSAIAKETISSRESKIFRLSMRVKFGDTRYIYQAKVICFYIICLSNNEQKMHSALHSQQKYTYFVHGKTPFARQIDFWNQYNGGAYYPLFSFTQTFSK